MALAIKLGMNHCVQLMLAPLGCFFITIDLDRIETNSVENLPLILVNLTIFDIDIFASQDERAATYLST